MPQTSEVWLPLHFEAGRRQAFAKQFPHIHIKPILDPSTGWDPCPARVFASPSWKLEENRMNRVWSLRGSKRDGIYVERKDRNSACVPGKTWVTIHPNLDQALYAHLVRCQREHAECLQRNIQRIEVRLADLGNDSDADEDDKILEAEIGAAEIEFGIRDDGYDSDDEEDNISMKSASTYSESAPSSAESSESATLSAESASEKEETAMNTHFEEGESHTEADESDECDEWECEQVVVEHDTPQLILDFRESDFQEYLYEIAM
ncbi:hypothetical protein DFH06DRAFT_1131420 [Mycena polygramma]|nr:hypothetical protein DFH06DRAFT_1131420 [Mycena polygramma]